MQLAKKPSSCWSLARNQASASLSSFIRCMRAVLCNWIPFQEKSSMSLPLQSLKIACAFTKYMSSIAVTEDIGYKPIGCKTISVLIQYHTFVFYKGIETDKIIGYKTLNIPNTVPKTISVIRPNLPRTNSCFVSDLHCNANVLLNVR